MSAAAGPPRQVVAGDAGALAALDALVNPNPWSASQFAAVCHAQAGNPERALLLEREGAPVGFVVYALVLDEACIHAIAVHPAQQGRGLGQSLLLAALERARDEGASRCYLEVRASNVAARHLYSKLGFGQDGTRKNYYATATGREDALLLSRPLDLLEG